MLFDTIMQALGKELQAISRTGTEKKNESAALNAIAGARVLLVEDNEINQQVAKEILEGAGLAVTIANNGLEAVNAVKAGNYDAVLMDVQMPVMDGYTATREIRKLECGKENPEVGIRNWEKKPDAQCSMLNAEDRGQNSSLQPPTSNLPIIAMTAHAMAGDEQKSLNAGMNDHVTKPIDPDKLVTTLQKWIRPLAERTIVQKTPVSDGAPVEIAEAEPVEDTLPESLAGFDLTAGLKRLMGNKKLYRKLLLDLGINYNGTAAEIREALAADDFKHAHSLVHNLKGLAGNLAATELQAAAVEMEKLVKGQSVETVSDEELHRKLTDLENALARVLESIETLGPIANEKTGESTEDEMSSVPPELAQKIADRIKAAVEMGDVIQVASIATELKSENNAATPFCDKIIRLSEDFDLDGILKLVNELLINPP
jgi:two-component system sensor histidine kinase/response regulator